MKSAIEITSVVGVLCIFMHEFDAFHRGEWKMFRFLNSFSEDTQYKTFLYAHIPLTLFIFYFLWTVLLHSNFILWIIMNLIAIAHLIVHILALKWKSNVFRSRMSFAFMFGWAISAIINLCLWNYY
jgi:hypothetical protein